MRTNGTLQIKLIVVTILMALFASSAFAQAPSDPTSDQIHQGNRKIAIGVGLVGAALLLGPLNEGAIHSNPRPSRDAVVAGLAGTGTVLIALGAWQRWRAVSPQTTLGVTLGNRTGIQIVRRW